MSDGDVSVFLSDVEEKRLKQQQPTLNKIIAAGVLTWLVPGAGHFYLGQRTRGIVFFVAITLAYWIGVAIGGAKSTVNYEANWAWFYFAEIFAGGYTLIALLIAKLPSALPSYAKTLDLATIYTGVAGLLSFLVILDALARGSEYGLDSGKEAK